MVHKNGIDIDVLIRFFLGDQSTLQIVSFVGLRQMTINTEWVAILFKHRVGVGDPAFVDVVGRAWASFSP